MAEQLHCILESTPALAELHLVCKAAPAAIWDSPSADVVPDLLSKYIPNLQHLVIHADFSMHKRTLPL